MMSSVGAPTPQWIWSDPENPAPKNRFTYFRKVVSLDSVPEDATLRLAADTNAQLWINGIAVRRKVTRYLEHAITADVISATPYLRPGKNIVVLLHHNWGDIITLQRTTNRHAGLWVQASWLASDESWRCIKAPEMAEHEDRIMGVNGDNRIRYPLIVDGRKAFEGNIHDPSFDDGDWPTAYVVTGEKPWPEVPEDVETPGQRDYFTAPLNVLAAGYVANPQPITPEPYSISAAIRNARVQPDASLTQKAQTFISDNHALTVEGKAGCTLYLTFDFFRAVHGYPTLDLTDAPAGVVIDWGYGELARSLFSGLAHVDENGWVNTEGVVGRGYADRYITRSGAQSIELPDERTARWLTLHIHFPADGAITIKKLGIVKSQYPIRMIGSFSCGDERVEQIVKLCQIHAEVTMTDAYVDTPGREDGQWVEDAQIRALIAERWFGDYKLRRILIRCLAQSQREDGEIHVFAPSGWPAYPGSCDWGVQWINCLYDDYRWTGKTDWVGKYWSMFCKYWESLLSHTDEEGLWRTARVFADLRVGLHCQNDRQSSGVVTPWIIERLGWSIELAEAIGDKSLAVKWREIRGKMIDAFRRYHIVPAGDGLPPHVPDRYDEEHPENPRGYCQAGQTIAVSSGLMTKEDALADIEYAFPAPNGTPPAGVNRWNNPTYSYRALSALSAVGLTERAVAHLIERYSPYLPGHPRNPVPLKLQGPYGTPLPEYWTSREDLGLAPGEKNTAQPDDETGSHGWGSVPLLWMHEELLGVRILEAGGGRIRIAPRTGGLPYVSGHTMTPKGLIWVLWDPQQCRLEVKIPHGVAAELVLPDALSPERWKIECSPEKGIAREGDRCLLSKAGFYAFSPLA